MTGPWAGRTALVTGGGSGLGRALTLELVRQGAAKVVAADVDAAAATRVAAEAGVACEGVALDVTRADEVAALVRRLGELDLLVNNAGIGLIGEARDLSVDEWRRVLDVNLLGVVHGVAAAYPRMCARGQGTLVNVASIMGFLPAPMMAPYAASKHAVIGLTKALRAEASSLGVRVTLACPGFIDTPIHDRTRFVGMRRAPTSARLKPATPAAVAAAILRGAARGQSTVFVPGHARVLWWLSRWAPWLLERLAARGAVASRRHRDAAV